MPIDDKGGMSGYSKPKNKPNSKEKIAARKAARKASGMSAQKFFVTTRLAEAAKRGKTLNAKDLRKQFQSGDVARKGFGAPKKKSTGGSSSGSTGSSSGSTGSSVGRKAYDGKKVTKPTSSLTSGGRYNQSPDTKSKSRSIYVNKSNAEAQQTLQKTRRNSRMAKP